MFTPTNAASVSRRLRSTSVGLSSAARLSAVTAPTGSPRLSICRAVASSISATRSSGPTLASARCHACR